MHIQSHKMIIDRFGNNEILGKREHLVDSGGFVNGRRRNDLNESGNQH